MMYGQPSIVPKCARFTLQSATTTMPATAATAIFSAVRLAGGATRPERRRRASREPDPAAADHHHDRKQDPADRRVENFP